MIQKDIAAILFDVGGTLRTSVPRNSRDGHDLIVEIQQRIGSDQDPAVFQRQLNRQAAAYRKWAKETRVELNERDLWTRWMLPDWPAERITPLAVELNQLWRGATGTRVVFRETGRAILELFRRGYRLGLVSNTTSSVEAPRLLEELGVTGCFDVVSLSCVEGVRKPDPAILLDAARRMGVEPSRCAYIGDRPDRDVAAARGAGFACAVLRRNRRKLETLMSDPAMAPDRVVSNLTELLDIFPDRSQTAGPHLTSPMYAASLSTMWARKNFANLNDFFLAALRIGFTQVELNHQMNTEILSQVDLSRYALSSVHEPCPADISMETLKERDWLISSIDEERRRKGVEAVRRSIELADRLGVRMLVVHSGQVSGEMGAEKQLRRLYAVHQTGTDEYAGIREEMLAYRAARAAASLDAVQTSLRELLEHAACYGVRLGLENRYHYNDIPTQDEMAILLDLAGADRLGFIYDVGHATAMDRLGFFPADGWLERFSARIFGTHLHDVIGLTDHQAPGLGDVDFRKIARYLPAESFRTVEVLGSNTPEQLRAGLKILHETGCIRKS
jgi:FMN phosphatase YigB (HAD superfamily)/sugar phosphate isomerase/epimerase